MNMFNLFQIFLLSTHLILLYGTSITQNPGYACEGENITVSCVLTVPNNESNITTLETHFIIGETDFISKSIINSNGTYEGIDLSRFTANAPLGTNLSVNGSITLLSYNSSTDEDLRLGCIVKLRLDGTLMSESFNRTLQLVTAAPPSAPNGLQSSVSNFNTSTCSADISLSWNTPPSNKTVDRYFLYHDGSPLATTNRNNCNHSTILNINTDYQYSVTAMSCAGNSTNSSSDVNSVKSYSLMSSQTECLDYNNVTGALTVNWSLSTPTQPSGVSGLDISYSLQLLYSHSRQGVTYTYTNSTSFTLPSSQLSYNTVLTAHNFTQLDGVETNITANLMIVQQCGQSFSGKAMECSFNSKTFSTPTNTTATIIIGCVVAAVVLLLILIIIIILIVLLVIFLRKRKENKEHTYLRADGSDVKNYQGLEEDTYSQVNKKTKPGKKDENELTYLEIDHSSGTGKIVRPPTIPKTNYADIADFPQETQYVSLQN